MLKIKRFLEYKKCSSCNKEFLAYEVQKMKEAYYYFIQFEADSTAPAEIESRMRIMDNVIRFLCVRQDEA